MNADHLAELEWYNTNRLGLHASVQEVEQARGAVKSIVTAVRARVRDELSEKDVAGPANRILCFPFLNVADFSMAGYAAKSAALFFSFVVACVAESFFFYQYRPLLEVHSNASWEGCKVLAVIFTELLHNLFPQLGDEPRSAVRIALFVSVVLTVAGCLLYWKE